MAVSGGRIPANRLASIDLPEPGGPIIRTLWPPAAATSSARLAVAWPRTSRKSGIDPSAGDAAAGAGTNAWNWSGLPRYVTTSARCRMPNTRMPSVTPASAALSAGTTTFRMPRLRAQAAMDSTPRTARSVPSSDSSPTSRCWSAGLASPIAPRIPMAIGKSNPTPSLRTLAGARLMVTALLG